MGKAFYDSRFIGVAKYQNFSFVLWPAKLQYFLGLIWVPVGSTAIV